MPDKIFNDSVTLVNESNEKLIKSTRYAPDTQAET